ncbi:MFS transporter [Jeongeupia naejangsanensis]|uniref:MFS transporter n=1 Tax=Jeongeupia naejangsanensis TaxID=613195 RepID=A0ABS2BJL9_9NEIS|nr:MFS transporter [Jeongeupia naejangsanensis]MBM3115191.1 MFS transporter [Jeongeupia naejangsanensis]
MQTALLVRFIISRFSAALGDQILLFAVPLIIYTETKSISLTGLAFFIEWTPRVLSLPIAGTLSDRIGGRFVYLTADIVRALAAFSAFYLLSVNANMFVVLSGLMAISAFFYAQSFIALESIVPKLASKAELPKVQSWLQGIEQASLMLGPGIGSFVVLYADARYLIPIGACMFLVGYLGTLTIKLPSMPISRRAEGGVLALIKQVRLDFVKAATIVRLRPNLLLLTALSVSINLIIGMCMATAAAMATGYFGASKAEFGLQQSFTGGLTLAVLMILPFVVHRINVFWVGIIAYAVICLSSVVIGVTSHFSFYVLAYATILAAGDLFNVYIRSERVLWIPKVHLGKTIGFIVFLNQLTLPLSGIIVSLSIHESDTKAMFWVIGLATSGIVVLCFKKLKTTSRILSPQLAAEPA